VVCQIQAVAQSSTKPAVRILLSGDTGVNAAAVKTLVGLGLPDLTTRVMPGISSPPAPQQTPLYMHGKQVIADAARAFVGSENITSTSLTKNRELGAIFTDAGMIQRLEQTFTTDFTTVGSSLPAQVCSSGSNCYTIFCQ
jgi:phosphatidylserine/phosphatidylglycerophosphate/cardiolipin synthase-like enzyme